MDQMSALDSAFVHAETTQASLHIASVAIFEGPEPAFEEIRAAIEAKLPEVPRLRQRWRTVPMALGRPLWVDDEGSTWAHTCCARGSPALVAKSELHDGVDSVMSQHLDLEGPPWEDWVLSGLEGGRWAMITKVHHSMVDGIAGTDLLSTLLDHAAEVRPLPAEEPWVPDAEPRGLALAAAAVRESARERVRSGRALVRSAARGATHPKVAGSPLARTGSWVDRLREGIPADLRLPTDRSARDADASTGGPASPCSMCSPSRSTSASPSTTWCSPGWATVCASCFSSVAPTWTTPRPHPGPGLGPARRPARALRQPGLRNAARPARGDRRRPGPTDRDQRADARAEELPRS